MFELLRELARNLGLGIVALVNALVRAGVTSSYFIRDTFRAHYNILGQFTAPIERNLLGTQPPSIFSLNIFGQIALTIFPLTVLAWITSLTIAPLIYNSIRFFKSSVVAAFSLIFLDIPEYDVGLSNEDISELKEIPWYRYIYGLPGIIVGGSLGLSGAILFGSYRVIANSFESLKTGFLFITNLALDREDLFDDSDFRPKQKIWLFGLPGLLIGAFFGAVVGFPVAAILRIVNNSFNNIKSLTVAGLNLVRKEPLEGAFEIDLKPSFLRKYVLGFPGLILGALSATVGIGLMTVQRILIESWKNTRQLFNVIVEQALPEDEDSNHLEELPLSQSDVRPGKLVEFLDRFVFGAPGIAVGIISGLIGFSTVIAWRVITNSYNSGLASFVAITNLAWHKDDEFEALPLKKGAFSFGLPGTVLGGLAGVLGFGIVISGRIISNSYKTTKRMTNSAVNEILYKNEQMDETLQNDSRSLSEKILGMPGFVIAAFTSTVGIVFAITRRGLIESWKSTKLVFNAIANEARLLTEDDLEQLVVEGVVIASKGKQYSRPSLDLIEEDEDEQRSFLDHILGSPGLLLGGLAGGLRFAGTLLAHVFIQSYKSAKRSFVTVTNFGLHSDHHISEKQLGNDLRSKGRIYGFGLPGIILGGFAGIFGFLVMGLGRNSYETAKRLQATSLNAVREEQLEENLDNDKRGGIFKYVLGFPGLIVGSIGSLVSITIVALNRSRIQSWITTKEFFNTIVNQVLPAEDPNESEDLRSMENSSFFEEQRSNLNRYVFGGPGVLFGVFSGSIAFAGIALVRTIVNSAKSMWASFISVSLLALDFNHQFENGLGKDKRHNPLKYGFGFPGVILGGFAGIFGFVAVGVGRIVLNSAQNIKKLGISGLNLVRHSDEQRVDAFENDAERSNFQKYFLGFPGLVLGSVGALFAIAIAAVERTAIESWKTTKIVYFSIADRAREEEFEIALESDLIISVEIESASEEEQLSAEDPVNSQESVRRPASIKIKKRSFIDHYIFGGPGLLLGTFSGLVGFAGIISGRIFNESLKTFKHSLLTLINLALDPEDVYSPEVYRRPLRYDFGFPGVILGGIAGGFAFVATGVARIITNSLLTIRSLTASGINVVRHEPVSNALKDDERTKFRIFGLGAPGLIIGSLSGFVGLALASLERVIIDSLIIGINVFTNMTARAFSESGEQTFRQVMANLAPQVGSENSIFGMPGYLFGAIAGSFGFAVVGTSRLISETIRFVIDGLGRVISESIATGIHVFISIANLGLNEDENEQFTYLQSENNDSRSWLAKYILGLPGAVIGAFFGGVTLAGIGAYKLTTHTFKSWISLSGSLLNGSLKLPLFSGLAADKRTTNQKIVGGLGYVLTLVTTLPLSALIFTFKTIIPIGLGLALGLITSPFVAAIKGITQVLNPPRFEENLKPSAQPEQAVEVTEQRFKNLYSSLDTWGQFAENGEIKENQDGRKGPKCFARKSFTFNISTIPENILNGLRDAYLISEDKEHFFDDNGEFENILEEIDEYYSGLSCLEPGYVIQDREEQISETGEFIRNYIRGGERKIPENLYANSKKSWSAIFWGTEPANSSLQEERPNPRMVV
ncbi:MAG: hypothetical protein H0T84_07020 [Tatlockia sp.]|nr:hypothetical protein [Tatlockia sp.]